MKTCFTIKDLAFDVNLMQDEKTGLFTVVYGAQAFHNLDYQQAATSVGECILHALACDGLVEA